MPRQHLAASLLGESVGERAAPELVAADVADLEGGVLVGKGEVGKVGRRRGVCPLGLLWKEFSRIKQSICFLLVRNYG